MEKPDKTFIGFLLSIKNISLTLIVNLVVGAYFYTLAKEFKLSLLFNVWIVVITIFMALMWMAFHYLSYQTYRGKKIQASKTNSIPNGKI